MANNENKKLVEQVFNEILNNRNLSLTDKLIGSNYVNHGFPDLKPGPAGFKQIVQQFLDGFPDMRIYVENIITDGDLVATRGYWTGTNKGSFMNMPSTGKKVRVEYIDFWKIQNGKAVENWVQMDMVGVMQQLGAMQPTA